MNEQSYFVERTKRRSVIHINRQEIPRTITVFPHQGYQLDPPQSVGSQSETLPLIKVIKVKVQIK